MNVAPDPQGRDNPEEPFVPDFSEGAETGLYLALLELLDEGLIITGDEVILEVNSAACRLLGRDYRQLAGQPLADIFPSERAFINARARLFIQGEMRGCLQLATPSGPRNLRFVAAARLRPGIHALIISPDHAAELHHDAIDDPVWPRLAAALEQPVLVIDQHERVAAANAAALRTLDCERSALSGQPLASCAEVVWPAPDAAQLATLTLGNGNTLSARVLPGPRPQWRLLILPPVAAIAPAVGAAPAADSGDCFRRIFADSPLPTLLCEGEALRIVAANGAATRLYGYDDDTLRGLHAADLRAADTCGRPHSASGIWRQRRADGSEFDTEVLCYPLESPAHPDRMVLMHDLPEQPLLASRLRLPVDVFDNSVQAILVCDADNRIITVNKAFTTITGYTLDEVRGKDPALLGAGTGDDGFADEMWQALERSGQWQGEIWNRRKNGEIYPEWLSVAAVRSTGGRVLHYIGMFSDLTSRRQAEARADYIATHDTLTSLPNRRLFERRFDEAAARARSTHRSLGMLRIDLDGFKAVNREHGDNSGDAILQQIARRLQLALPRGATVARERSDTFLVLLPELGRSNELSSAAETLRATIAQPFEIDGRSLSVAASIGIAVFPEDGGSFEVIARNAEAALAHARQLGGNHHQFYTDEMSTEVLERMAFELNLSHAVERDQLEVHYQPLVDGRSGALRGGEALLRWRHPELGLIPFRRLLGAARESGVIAELGDWVLHAACRDAARWPAVDGHPALLTINIAIEQIIQGNLPERVAAALRDSGLPAAQLELDIDEIILKEEHGRIHAALKALAAMGVRLAIDGYGQGLSSIPRLRRHPLHAIKLDPALVRDVGASEDAEAVVEAIASMAGVLGLEILGRGVEGEAQQAFLCALGCSLQQGPLFGRPLAADEFVAYLGERSGG